MHPRIKQFVTAPLAGLGVMFGGGAACSAFDPPPVGQVQTFDVDSEIFDDRYISAEVASKDSTGKRSNTMWLKVESINGTCVVEGGLPKQARRPLYANVQIQNEAGETHAMEITEPATEDTYPKGSFRKERGRLRVQLDRPHEEPGLSLTSETAIDVAVTDISATGGYRVTMSPKLSDKSKVVSIDCLF